MKYGMYRTVWDDGYTQLVEYYHVWVDSSNGKEVTYFSLKSGGFIVDGEETQMSEYRIQDYYVLVDKTFEQLRTEIALEDTNYTYGGWSQALAEVSGTPVYYTKAEVDSKIVDVATISEVETYLSI